MKNVSLPLLPRTTTPPELDPSFQALATELQSFGLRWIDHRGPGLARSGGAGPSDHKAISLGGHTIMVPIFNGPSAESPYVARIARSGDSAVIERAGEPLTRITFPSVPRFYALRTSEGIPYWKIATLHGTDVLATTVLQTCIRYGRAETTCQFCAIGQSLSEGTTIARKTPEQLAEVARAALELDAVRHVVLTTGTPKTPDRGAAVLAEAAQAITDATGLPIQAQCEPPDDDVWFERLSRSGVVTLGMHVEAVSERTRQEIMPGKAEVPLDRYFQAFEAAVRTFGRGQVTTYILAGLGDTEAEIVKACERLVALGVHPFVVPFVPISGTLLQRKAPPSAAFMRSVLTEVAGVMRRGGISSAEVRAGCGRCGACSSLATYERPAAGPGAGN